MREFMEVYPEIEVHLILSDRELDLSMREADVADALAPPRQADLIQRHLLTVHMHIYAGASYIKKNGMPGAPEDLDDHRIVVYGHDTKPPVPGRQLAAQGRTRCGGTSVSAAGAGP